ncbi:MAG: hypothetical protein EOO04_09955 [Chitinophagaceae bacterium]|nr:MAG: hypothetical protein EOO04_09955 [Chitinophagaceae bacterium]
MNDLTHLKSQFSKQTPNLKGFENSFPGGYFAIAPQMNSSYQAPTSFYQQIGGQQGQFQTGPIIVHSSNQLAYSQEQNPVPFHFVMPKKENSSATSIS